MQSRYTALIVLLTTLWLGGVLLAQESVGQGVPSIPTLKLDTGEEIFEAACVACHGHRGTGQPQSTLGFEPPATFPDFSDCNGSTREKTFDWRAVIYEGGEGRGFSAIMPSFAESLTLDQIDKVMAYMREQCAEPAWPLGELNLPRALFTEKAFPEDEWIIAGAANVTGGGEVSKQIIYEKRFGARNQIEIVVPFSFVPQGAGWAGGVGDVIAGYKRVLFSSLPAGSIFSVQGEMAMPTGDHARGLGSGVKLFEMFAAFGQILPRLGFVQIQSGAEFPSDTDKVPRTVFGRLALGKTFAANPGFGRSWTPIIELLTDREFQTGARTYWDIVPQMQVTVNKRQHIRVNVGVRQPLNNTEDRATQVVFYALWDFFDGGLRDGW